MTSLSARDYGDFDPWDVVLNAVPDEYSMDRTGWNGAQTEYEFTSGIWDRGHPEAAVEHVSFDLAAGDLTPPDALRESPDPPPQMPQQKSIPVLYDEWLEKRRIYERSLTRARRRADRETEKEAEQAAKEAAGDAIEAARFAALPRRGLRMQRVDGKLLVVTKSRP